MVRFNGSVNVSRGLWSIMWSFWMDAHGWWWYKSSNQQEWKKVSGLPGGVLVLQSHYQYRGFSVLWWLFHVSSKHRQSVHLEREGNIIPVHCCQGEICVCKGAHVWLLKIIICWHFVQRNRETVMAAAWSSFIMRQSGKWNSCGIKAFYGFWHFYNISVKNGGGYSNEQWARLDRDAISEWKTFSWGTVYGGLWNEALQLDKLQNFDHPSREWAKILKIKKIKNHFTQWFYNFGKIKELAYWRTGRTTYPSHSHRVPRLILSSGYGLCGISSRISSCAKLVSQPGHVPASLLVTNPNPKTYARKINV